MKTITEKKTKSGLKNRPEPLSTASQRQIDFRRRAANRSLETEKLLALLESETPKFFELAEVVGKWVWIQFAGRQSAKVTRILAELGFHWNNARKAWQHPCGTSVDDRATYDPRQRYGSYYRPQNPARLRRGYLSPRHRSDHRLQCFGVIPFSSHLMHEN
jgi:hypothetical protein